MKLVQESKTMKPLLSDKKPRYDATDKVSVISITDTNVIVAIDEGDDMFYHTLMIETEDPISVDNKVEVGKILMFAAENISEISDELNDCIVGFNDQEEDEESDTINLLMTNGDIYHVPKDSVNWEHNAENIGNIENVILQFKEFATRLLIGASTPEKIIEEANNAIGSLGVSFDDKFFGAIKDITDREKALCAILDVMFVYTTIGNMTNIYIAHQHFQNEMNTLMQEVMSNLVPDIQNDITVEEELDGYADDNGEILGNVNDVIGGD